MPFERAVVVGTVVIGLLRSNIPESDVDTMAAVPVGFVWSDVSESAVMPVPSPSPMTHVHRHKKCCTQ